MALLKLIQLRKMKGKCQLPVEFYYIITKVKLLKKYVLQHLLTVTIPMDNSLHKVTTTFSGILIKKPHYSYILVGQYVLAFLRGGGGGGRLVMPGKS